MNEWMIPVLALTVWNIVTFALYGADKSKAKKKKRRISETNLILCAFLMGGLGALLGMLVFRHKTKHLKFKLLIPFAFIVNIGIIMLVLHQFDIISLWEW